ncbi:hypothetical protein HPB48_006996 [Haemaphysalis longicornis]|uniref:THAP-type domain-containing protein n=1 Tax=Haemaphysalis longicornis TaxID=44386 RepID=A0A9J6GXG5_HAELO|nr:hypothetical protein HPB48_006996 [Haemaphysalis longicornis]
MPTCFAPGSTSGYRKNTQKRHFFAPPSDPELLRKWKRVIPRADKELSKTCKCTDFAEIVESSAAIRLPANWRTAALEEEPGQRRQIVLYVAGMKAGAYTILKSVVVWDDITYLVHANGKLLRQSSFDVEIRSLQDLEALLQIVHSKNFCLGCSSSDVATSRAGVKVGGTLFHRDCSVLTDADKGVCNMCISLIKNLKKKASLPARKKVPVAASVLRKRETVDSCHRST